MKERYHMKINKAAAIPLVTCDPFFSIWSAHDNLNDGGTTHWCGKKQTINGYVKINEITYCFLGNPDFYQKIKQTELHVTATKTKAVFENDDITLQVTFTTPLLLDDPYVASRPVTYIDFMVTKKNSTLNVEVYVTADATIVTNEDDDICGGTNQIGEINYSSMGKMNQKPLGESGDNVTINWGYLYLATTNGITSYDEKDQQLTAQMSLDEHKNATIVIAYDDLVSINYFGDFIKGLWTKKDKTILNAIVNAVNEYETIMDKCRILDSSIEDRAKKIGGDAYAFLCNMSYRQSISAHKIIADTNGELVFLSKENDSNGCIGTADVSYPSIPLFMLFGTEYVKGMVRPIMKFAQCDVWDYDFAPHDVGRYPYACGQVYGVNRSSEKMKLVQRPRFADKAISPPYYMFPKNSNIYELENQMPVEECGNMIIMIANVCFMDNNGDFAKQYIDILAKWVEYLVKFGSDPGTQLCTDDFAGHLAHNVNLALKAIMGIEGYAIICKLLGNLDGYNNYHNIAKEMAKDCECRASTSTHSKLTFDNADSWSLKYNMIWDKIWKTQLFSESFFEKEIAYYLTKMNAFGIPLDSRKEYTKSDWVLWCTAMAKTKEQREQMVIPVANFLENSQSRVAFSDWYDTKSGTYMSFIARSVQGGIFMPIMFDNFLEK